MYHQTDWDYFYPGYENWYHAQAPAYHYQQQQHHRARRKYGPYLVPSDPYLLHSAAHSDYFYAKHHVSGFPTTQQQQQHLSAVHHSSAHPSANNRRFSNHVG